MRKGRFGTAAQIAAGAIIPARDEARFVDGAQLVIDSGCLAA